MTLYAYIINVCSPAIAVPVGAPIPMESWSNPKAFEIKTSPTMSTMTTANKVTYPPEVQNVLSMPI